MNWEQAKKSDGRQKLHGEYSHRCPPLSSVKLCFHTDPSLTFTSKPSMRSLPSGDSSLAKLPGSSSPKISPKSLRAENISDVVGERGEGEEVIANLHGHLVPSLLQCSPFMQIELSDGHFDLFLVL